MSDVALLPSVNKFLGRDHGHYIDGGFSAGSPTGKITVVNPANGEAIAQVSEANQGDIDHAVASANTGFKVWSKTSPAARAAVLFKLADLLERNREELAQLETCQSGKIIQISRAFEVDQAAHFLRYYAGGPKSREKPSLRHCPLSQASVTPLSPCVSQLAWSLELCRGTSQR